MTSRIVTGIADGVLSSESWTISHDGGKTVVYTNPLRGTTTYKYTDTGKLQEQDNPDGSVLKWNYQTDGRIASETYVDARRRAPVFRR